MTEREFIIIAAVLAAVALCVGISIVRRVLGSAARRGRKGELKVRRELARLGNRDYRVINDLMTETGQGRTSQIDHVVVSTRGIFVIETKSHVGRITGGEHSQYWTQRLMMSSRDFYNPLLQNAAHVKALRRLLRGVDDSLFVSVVVFSRAWRLDIEADDIMGRGLFGIKRSTRRTLDPEKERTFHWWRRGHSVVLDRTKMAVRLPALRKEIKKRDRIISRDEMNDIADRLEALNVRDRRVRRQHRQYARQTARHAGNEIRHGVCPRCGMPLMERRGERGPFLGCSAYPECRFTCSVDAAGIR